MSGIPKEQYFLKKRRKSRQQSMCTHMVHNMCLMCFFQENTKKCAKMKTHNFDRFWLVSIAQKAWPGENFYIQINLRCRAIHPKVEIEIVTWSRHVSEVFFEPCWRSKIAKIPKKCQNFAKIFGFAWGTQICDFDGQERMIIWICLHLHEPQT